MGKSQSQSEIISSSYRILSNYFDFGVAKSQSQSEIISSSYKCVEVFKRVKPVWRVSISI